MAIEIYYFSGTGNSLAVARDIASKIDGDLISIPSVMGKERIQSDAGVVGIVFPVYFAPIGGIPFIVEDFVKKLNDLGSKYIFAVCTHKGGPGSTIEHLGKMISSRGGKLACGFTVQMSYSIPALQKMKRAFFHREINYDSPEISVQQQKLLDIWKKKLDFIVNCINGREEIKLETSGSLRKIIAFPYNSFMKFMFSVRYKQLSGIKYLSFNELVHHADTSFQINEDCTGCGTCSRVCPVGNIEMVDGKPKWQHHCENCTACFQWCPRDAIHGEIVAYEEKYHHPSVKRSDMLRQNVAQNVASN
ncbi:MAG: EFR1 family ferrodoxin [Candidatus Odinarchaeota archaeon]